MCALSTQSHDTPVRPLAIFRYDGWLIIRPSLILTSIAPNHAQVYAFMLAEMGTTGSIDASSRMVIKGRFPPKAIEQIVRRYPEALPCSSLEAVPSRF